MQEKLDKAKYLNRVIIASWIGLALCFVIKIFGGNIFEVACANENFIAVCDYAENNQWAYYLIGAVYCFISLYFYVLAILKQLYYKNWQLIILILTVLIGSYIKIINSNFGWLYDYLWQFSTMIIIFLGKRYKEYWKVLFAMVLLIGFQLISLLTRNLGIQMVTNSGVLVSAIYSIDVVLMVILYYLYCNSIKNKKEK